MYCFVSSVVGGVEVRPPLGDLGCALFSQALLVLIGHPGVAPWLLHEGLTKFEGGLGHELVPPGAVLRQGSPFREGEKGEVWGKRRSSRRLNEQAWVVKPVRACLWRNAFFVWCSPAGVVQGTA